jgi:hypothetical protein
MTVKTFSHTYFVRAPAPQIYEHLAEPANYAGLSPLVGKISDVEWDVNEQHQSMVTYKTIEMFHFLGFITYPNPLNVVMALTTPNQQIISDVQSSLGIRVRFTFDLQPQGDGANITETITANAPTLLMGFVISQAKSVQQHREKVLKQRLENPNQKSA